MQIAGMHFTGFAGSDAANLPRLDYDGRVVWLRNRFELVFLTPFKKLVDLDNDCYIWLCVVSLLAAAVEALADFEFRGSGMDQFSQFVEKYFSADFRNAALRLDDPRPMGKNIAVTPAQHFYKYFRCGLSHSFCIEWGGVRHLPEGAPGYLFEHEPIPGRRSLGIAPRELVTDFLSAVDRFLVEAASWKPGSLEAATFDQHFSDVFLICTAAPAP
jgi:hypothetical protein